MDMTFRLEWSGGAIEFRSPYSVGDGDDYVIKRAETWLVSFVILSGTYLIARDASD
jgi:hypothetical protein